MSSLGTDGGGATYNSVSGDAVVVGPLLMAQHIEGIQLPPAAPAAPAAPPCQGPPPTRVFVNRTEELAGLRDAALALAADPEPGVVMVVGVGGVGKTQLVAQAVRRELTRLFADGQLYVDLEDHRRDGAVDLAAVLGGFLRALGVHKDYVPGGLAERTALFRSVAAPLRLIVKVDNVQHAPEALVPPQGLLVVTGRRALPSLPMDGAVLIDVAPLDEAAGTELVRRWYADADEGTAADVVRLCAGHPLALRAAVEWLAARPQLTLDDVVRDLTAGRYGTGDDGAREAMGVARGANGGAAQGRAAAPARSGPAGGGRQSPDDRRGTGEGPHRRPDPAHGPVADPGGVHRAVGRTLRLTLNRRQPVRQPAPNRRWRVRCRSCDQTCAHVVREWSTCRAKVTRSGQKRA
ncbi:hypothetical protein [Streptomyces microflavus]|uniref:hypothetical protein n=1 Tax=Streptomyces microflavus TaxID=1919 RepID=UPI001EF1745B|nr:hypothetical protein [Streptomyces microflavus]